MKTIFALVWSHRHSCSVCNISELLWLYLCQTLNPFEWNFLEPPLHIQRQEVSSMRWKLYTPQASLRTKSLSILWHRMDICWSLLQQLRFIFCGKFIADACFLKKQKVVEGKSWVDGPPPIGVIESIRSC